MKASVHEFAWFLYTPQEDKADAPYLVRGMVYGNEIRNHVGGWARGHSPTKEQALADAKDRLRKGIESAESMFLKRKAELEADLAMLDGLNIETVRVMGAKP